MSEEVMLIKDSRHIHPFPSGPIDEVFASLTVMVKELKDAGWVDLELSEIDYDREVHILGLRPETKEELEVRTRIEQQVLAESITNEKEALARAIRLVKAAGIKVQ